MQLFDSPTYFTTGTNLVNAMQTTVSCRIPERLNTALEETADSEGVVRSELIRQALRHYIHENPDGLKVLNKSATEIAPQKINSELHRSNTRANDIHQYWGDQTKN